jgi:hypothetical protein
MIIRRKNNFFFAIIHTYPRLGYTINHPHQIFYFIKNPLYIPLVQWYLISLMKQTYFSRTLLYYSEQYPTNILSQLLLQ